MPTLRTLALLAAAAATLPLAAFWLLTLPAVVPASALPPYTPNLDNGRTMFAIGGCASCHAVPNKDPDKVDRTRLGGGLALTSPFGTFYVPNISPDPKDGIGRWSEANFVTALWKGTSPAGANLYPAFPYTSYQHMQLDDVRDLFAYLKTLPPVPGRVRRHDLKFPFNERRLLGGWKLLFLHGGPFVPDPSRRRNGTAAPIWSTVRGIAPNVTRRAICSAPLSRASALPAARRPDGGGWVPNITPAGLQHGDEIWSEKDIASFLGDGMMPSGDFAGSTMAEVIRNTSLLGAEDRAAIADYIFTLPPVQGPTPPPKKRD